jgi:hypothetical protein
VDVFKHKCAHNRILSRLEHCELCVQSARERAVAKAGAPGVMTRGGGLIGEDELRHRVERFPETLATEEPFKPGPYDALRAAGVAVAPSGLFVAVGDEAVAALSEHLRTTGGEVVKMAAQEPEQTYERYEGVSVFQSPPRHEVRGIRTKWTKTPAETIAAESPYTITRKDFGAEAEARAGGFRRLQLREPQAHPQGRETGAAWWSWRAGGLHLERPALERLRLQRGPARLHEHEQHREGHQTARLSQHRGEARHRGNTRHTGASHLIATHIQQHPDYNACS